jgi:hypothetical protein
MFNRSKIVMMVVVLLFSMNGFARHDAMDKAVTEFKLAFDELDPGLISQLNLKNLFANQSALNYFQKEKVLYREMLLNMRGNSFVLGVCLACLNRLAGFERNKMAPGMLPGVAGLLILQNQQIGQLPYYNLLFSADVKNNFLTSKSILFSRAMEGVVAAMIGYIGVNYIFDRLDGFEKIKQAANQAEMDQK